MLERPEAEDSYKDQKLYVKGLLEKGGRSPAGAHLSETECKKRSIQPL